MREQKLGHSVHVCIACIVVVNKTKCLTMERQQADAIKHAYRNLTHVVDLDKGVQKSE